MSNASSTRTSNARVSSTIFCEFGAKRAMPSSFWRSPASVGASVPVAVAGAWLKVRRCWSMRSFPNSRYAYIRSWHKAAVTQTISDNVNKHKLPGKLPEHASMAAILSPHQSMCATGQLSSQLMSTPTPAASGTTPWLALLSIALGASLAPLDSSVNVAFPAIISAFARPITDIRWVIIVYVLVYASLPLVFGRAGDVFGHRRVFLFGLGWCAVAYLGCALASQFHWLLLARINQGVGSALILATAPALFTLTLPAGQRTRGVALYTLAFAISATLGPLIGGALVQSFGWPAVFWMRIPIALAAIIMTLALVPAAPRSDAGNRDGARFDPLSGIALALGLAATLLVLGQGAHFGWTSPITLALGGTGVIMLWQFSTQRSSW